jgi:hypothetical protein
MKLKRPVRTQGFEGTRASATVFDGVRSIPLLETTMVKTMKWLAAGVL